MKNCSQGAICIIRFFFQSQTRKLLLNKLLREILLSNNGQKWTEKWAAEKNLKAKVPKIGFFLCPRYPSKLPSTFHDIFLQNFFQGGSKTGPRCKQVEFTATVVLHKLKWVPRFEKSVHRNFDFDPNAVPGYHLESRGHIPGPFSGNAILKNFLIRPKMRQKLRSWKTLKDQNCSNGIFLEATLS